MAAIAKSIGELEQAFSRAAQRHLGVRQKCSHKIMSTFEIDEHLRATTLPAAQVESASRQSKLT
jgi:hypothetical protein